MVDSITEDGLYIGKRAIRGAQGQGDLLNQAGTVLYHTVVYIRANGKAGPLSALPYYPDLHVSAFLPLLGGGEHAFDKGWSEP